MSIASAADPDERDQLEELAARIGPTTLSRERTLAVAPALAGLLPGRGLRRGSTVAVDGPAATSLALALAAEASAEGAWTAAVGFPSLGLAAAVEYGISLERFVLVADPGDDDTAPAAIAALIDAFEIVLVRTDARVRDRDARRLMARGRERGAVLVRVGEDRPTRAAWPVGADVGLTITSAAWEGLGSGHGHLRARRVTIEAGGRRDAARPRRSELWLPAPGGGVEEVVAAPVPLRARSAPSPAEPHDTTERTAPSVDPARLADLRRQVARLEAGSGTRRRSTSPQPTGRR